MHHVATNLERNHGDWRCVVVWNWTGTLVFFSVRLLPGDYADIILSDPNLGGGTQADKERLREMLGLMSQCTWRTFSPGTACRTNRQPPTQPLGRVRAPAGPGEAAGAARGRHHRATSNRPVCRLLDPSSIAAT